MDVGLALTVDVVADGTSAVTVTTAVCVMATPSIVAETVLAPATVEVSVPVATPLALVGPAGCVTVLPVPVAEITTVAPLMGAPPASRAVTVTVALPLPAVIEDGAAATVDWDGEGGTPVTLNPLDVAPVSPVAAAVSV
jgi:hypothetical protein